MDTNKTILVAGATTGAIIAVGIIIAAAIMSGPPGKGTVPGLSSIKAQLRAADDRVFNVTNLEYSSSYGALRIEVYHRDGGGVAHHTKVIYYRDMGGVYRYKSGSLAGDRGETWRNNVGIWP